MVGNTLVCDSNIYGSQKPETYNEAFRAIVPLAKQLGLLGTDPTTQLYRVSDTQAPPYYPAGTYTNIPASVTAEQPVQPYYDQYNYHQSPTTPDGSYRPMPAGQPAPQNFDPFSYHQNDKTNPGNPGVPRFTPAADLPLPPLPPKPGDLKPEPAKPVVNQPRPDQRPGNPCQPCRPCRPGGGRDGGCGWYPGKIAGRVVGRIFGGGRRCR